MCGNGPYLIGLSENGTVRARFQGDCESWSCDECRKMLVRKWKKRAHMHVKIQTAVYGRRFYFVTLTLNPDLDASHTYSASKKVWDKFMRHLRRAQPGFQYLAVWEQHKNKRFHIHVLTDFVLEDLYEYRLKEYKPMTRSRFLDSVLNRYADTMGWVHHVSRVEDAVMVAAYVSKYLTKTLAYHLLSKRQRVVVTSRKWWKEPSANSSDLTFIRVPKHIYDLADEDLQAWVDTNN